MNLRSELRTIAVCETNVEAWIVRNFLATNGIRAAVDGEFMIKLWWIYGLLLGGVSIRVHSYQEPEARALLEENARLRDKHVDFMRAADFELEHGQSASHSKCDECGSEDLYTVRYSRNFAVWSMYLLGVPLPYPWVRRDQCADCGYLESVNSAQPLPSHQFSLSDLAAITTGAGIGFGILRFAFTLIL